MYKARQETESGGNNLMTEIIHVDEFVLGWRDQNQVGRS
jgi:hypothetical protein